MGSMYLQTLPTSMMLQQQPQAAVSLKRNRSCSSPASSDTAMTTENVAGTTSYDHQPNKRSKQIYTPQFHAAYSKHWNGTGGYNNHYGYGNTGDIGNGGYSYGHRTITPSLISSYERRMVLG